MRIVKRESEPSAPIVLPLLKSDQVIEDLIVDHGGSAITLIYNIPPFYAIQ